MTHFIEAQDLSAGDIFFTDGEKWLMLVPPLAINIRGSKHMLARDKLVKRAPSGTKITVRQA